jgi:hypothetical protein
MVTTSFFWMIALAPALVFPYLLFAYARRFGQRKELIRSLLTNSNAIADYSRAFRASGDLHSTEWKRRLDLDIESYLYPTALCFLISLAGSIAILSAGTSNALGLETTLSTFVSHTPPAALAGFAGAYVWSLYDFSDRFRILNLPTNALHSMWFRMVLSPIAATLAQVVLNDSAAPLVGFAIGMLPVATVINWVQDNARQRLGAAAGTIVPPMWEQIQGMTPDIVARLEEAGVTSAAHLANQDPVGLLRRTNIEWRNVLDMMDQAFLLMYVSPNLAKLRGMGIRGAIEASILYKYLIAEKDAPGHAHATLEAMAEALGSKPPVIENLLRNLSEDPQVALVSALWYDRAAAPSPSDQDLNPEDVKKDLSPEDLKKDQ